MRLHREIPTLQRDPLAYLMSDHRESLNLSMFVAFFLSHSTDIDVFRSMLNLLCP